MIAVDPGDAAMAVAHVFAEADVRYHEQLGTFGLDRTDRLLHDALFRVGTEAASSFSVGMPKRMTACNPASGARGFGGYLVGASWSTPGMLLMGRRALIFSFTKSGRMKSCGLRLVSRTRLRRPRCGGDGADDEPISSPAEATRTV